MPGTFFPPLISKETANYRSRHASRHVRHARAVMHVGITSPQLRGKRSRHSRRMRHPQLYVSGKRPIMVSAIGCCLLDGMQFPESIRTVIADACIHLQAYTCFINLVPFKSCFVRRMDHWAAINMHAVSNHEYDILVTFEATSSLLMTWHFPKQRTRNYYGSADQSRLTRVPNVM